MKENWFDTGRQIRGMNQIMSSDLVTRVFICELYIHHILTPNNTKGFMPAISYTNKETMGFSNGELIEGDDNLTYCEALREGVEMLTDFIKSRT